MDGEASEPGTLEKLAILDLPLGGTGLEAPGPDTPDKVAIFDLSREGAEFETPVVAGLWGLEPVA